MAIDDEKRYIRNSPVIGRKFREFQTTLMERSVLDKKTKELLMLALASVFRCRYCTEAHIKGTLDAGATREEVAEALLTAALEAAGTQLYWAKDTYEKYF